MGKHLQNWLKAIHFSWRTGVDGSEHNDPSIIQNMKNMGSLQVITPQPDPNKHPGA